MSPLADRQGVRRATDRRCVLVMGVGNILLRDEGAGVHAVHRLQRDYLFSSNVRLLDGGTLGMRLLDPIAWADVLIVADAALMGQVPGTVARLSPDELHALSERKTSMHEVSLAETFTLAAMLGTLPETFIVAIEPQDVSSWDTSLSESVAAGLDVMVDALLAEIVAAGASCCRRAVPGGLQPGVEPVASRYGTR